MLGPLLFLLFINDIPNSSQKLNFVLFVDDTNMLYADRHPKSLEETVNKELKNVCEWLHVNKLTLNIKKSNFVIFRPPQRSLNYELMSQFPWVLMIAATITRQQERQCLA